MAGSVYDDTFFDRQVQGALESARIVVPTVLEFMRPDRVIDVGCGVGAWLRAFKEAGVREVFGLDGAYVNQARLLIDPSEFRSAELTDPLADIGRFDSAICLEVAEHLPASAASGLVRSLTAVAPLVLFSAALPLQGGTHHVNEQRPRYWQALFAEQGFERLDLVRPRIWQDQRVEFWYRQNMVLFASQEALTRWDHLRTAADNARNSDLELVHKELLEKYVSGSVWLPAIWENFRREFSHYAKRIISRPRNLGQKELVEKTFRSQSLVGEHS